MAVSPVEEIRVDYARKGDNVVEVRLADRRGTVYRVRQHESDFMRGNIELENTGCPLRRLGGEVASSRPKEGLAGEALFDGCLP